MLGRTGRVRDAYPVEYEREALVTQSKPVALWAVPRSISTAFERVFVERDDFEVLHEPFSASYYYSEDRLSDRYLDVEPRAENNYENVLAEVFKPREKRLFPKDMPYQAKGVMSPEFIRRFTNTFIIRDPKYVIASMYKMWPDFTPEETAAGAEPATVAYRLEPAGGAARTVRLEVAADPAARARGLMGRTEVPQGTGMVFLYPADVTQTFWMKNTLVPLSIAFVAADGRVVSVAEMTPCRADPCPTYAPAGPYRYAVELAAGSFPAAGVGPGAKVAPTDPAALPEPA
jgi:uncharacterized membrane protein (UPF0127 family)